MIKGTVHPKNERITLHLFAPMLQESRAIFLLPGASQQNVLKDKKKKKLNVSVQLVRCYSTFRKPRDRKFKAELFTLARTWVKIMIF